MEIYRIVEIIIGVLFVHYLIKLEEWIPSYVVKYYELYKKKRKHRRNKKRTPEEIQRAVLPQYRK